jgi:hypothetical protein
MTDRELEQYIGEWVEIRFTDDKAMAGKLVTGGDIGLLLEPHPYALEIPPTNLGEAITWFPIPDTSVIISIRTTERRQRR